ncbi:MAG: oligopeptide/dipeptide ABC transporter ATP-binding protein [Planctomycetota bacterium]|nr:oligopeptide/dipeptide ABC transporter ATP-binding protein [Planctomycetota bacterium]
MSQAETNLAGTATADGGSPVLRVEDLKIHFPFSRGSWWKPQRGFIRAVDGISFEVADGETLGLVGESGCGKSTTARGIVNLLRPTAGKVFLDGERIDQLDDRQMRAHRRKVQMIFQDPFASLNPRMTVGRIIAEPLEVYGLYDRDQRRYEVMRLLELVGLNPRFLNRYPHEFSGGQRQRIGIARALAVQPKLIVCDEPVSALDVSIQAQVINLLMDLQQKLGLSYVFIAHDLAVIRHIAHRVGVMYLGRIVELADADQLYENPQHPYTQALLSAAPAPDPQVQRGRQRVLLKGEVPSPDREYPGCPFADRCPLVEELCRQQVPQLAGETHQVSCLKV